MQMTNRALVLSGGGPVGIAWETGFVAGLAEEGVLLAEADVIVGTSAGSVVGAQLALGTPPQAMAAAQLAGRGQRAQEGTPPAAAAADAPPDLTPLMQMMLKAADGEIAQQDLWKEIGAFALKAKTVPEEQFVGSFGNRLAGSEGWPEKPYICTAIDCLDGTFQIWDKSSGVSLARAVASSCAVPGIYPPITINGRRYMDGGMRSASNADLAKGRETVVIISLVGGPGAAADPRAEQARRRIESEIAALTEAGAKVVELLTPDPAAREAFGPNMMDSRRNAGATEQGLRQGKAEAARLRKVWA